LPWLVGSFDVATAVNALQYAERPVAALRELKRVVVPHGRIVVAIWGRAEDNVARTAIEGALQSAVPPGSGHWTGVSLSAPGALEAIVAEAGLDTLSAGDVTCRLAFGGPEDFWQAWRSSGAVQALLTEGNREDLKRALTAAVEPFGTGGGRVEFDARFRYVVLAAEQDRP
jgi:SAM-dependent methyltransferase